MNRVRPRGSRGADVLLGLEVARDLDDLVCASRMERARVVGCHHGHGLDPELAAGTEDAHGDLPAVRDE